MRISDWSSDVCSSDLPEQVFKVGLEPGVDECRDHRVEDIDDGAGGGTGIRERPVIGFVGVRPISRSEEHTSELQSLMRISYAVFCLKKKKTTKKSNTNHMTIKYERDNVAQITTSKK